MGLVSFDFQAMETCSDSAAVVERTILGQQLQRQLHVLFFTQQSTLEEKAYQRLKKDLIRKMWRTGGDLPVRIKLRLLRIVMREYDAQIRELMPEFIKDSERARVERRLSELQWGILDTPEGKDLQQRWQTDRIRRMPMRQSRGISVSLSPGMR